MIDKKEMLMKVASYDKTACVLSDVVLTYKDMMAKKAESEVVPSNVYFNVAADMAAEQPVSQRRILTGAGLGLLAGLLGGVAIGKKRSIFTKPGWSRQETIPAGAAAGVMLGSAIPTITESIRLGRKQRELIEKYRAAEAKQNGVDEDEQKKAASVSKRELINSIINKVMK